MPPSLALFISFIFIIVLIRRDPARYPEVSAATWLPLIYMLILSSRLPSQWLGITATTFMEATSEGNWLDRLIYILLTLLSVIILKSRPVRWSELIRGNASLVALIALGFLSIAWSDFPFISMKRWIRDFGGYLMIVVVMSETDPLKAVETVIRRACYLLIPLSIIFIKYFPFLGRGYDAWTGMAYYTGVTNNKNLLGVLCVISGLFFFWDILKRWSVRKETNTRRIIFVNLFFIAMTLWLMQQARSATSNLCLFVGCTIIALGHSLSVRRNPAKLKILIPLALSAYFILDFVFDIRQAIADLVGRDVSFTGRTELWDYLKTVKINALLGTGYESFWLGTRLQQATAIFTWGPNQAHNGYLEMYLNLGILGLLILGIFLIASYRRICRGLTTAPNTAFLCLTLWTMLLLYDITESAFKIHMLWFTFLLLNTSLSLVKQPGSASAKAETRNPNRFPRLEVSRRYS